MPVQGRTASHAEVSLFTREWIEIESAPHSRYLTIQSPSLRGSGLKLLGFIWKKSKSSVSLFTREWIEICSNVPCFPGLCRVSLFTREWIEIESAPHSRYLTIQSPSLRGSGLKLLGFIWKKSKSSVSLFTREWIEICSNVPCFPGLCRVSLFTREWIEISS